MTQPIFDGPQFRMVVGPAIPDAATVGAAPTQAQHNDLVGKFNALLAIARAAGLIAR